MAFFLSPVGAITAFIFRAKEIATAKKNACNNQIYDPFNHLIESAKINNAAMLKKFS
jgi:hypothetical protein